MFKVRPGVAICFALISLALTGCGGPPSGKLSGKVTYKDEPVSGGSVTLVPKTEGNPYAYAETGADGSYIAKTDDYGTKIPVGKYQVLITAVKDHGTDKPAELLLPLKYSSEKSGLEVTIEKGDNVENFDLKP